MTPKRDVKMMLPAEYINEIIEVIECGLDKSKIDPNIRKKLLLWWEVEKEFIDESL